MNNRFWNFKLNLITPSYFYLSKSFVKNLDDQNILKASYRQFQ